MHRKKLIIIYFFASLIWIYGSNYLVAHFVPDSYMEILARIKEIFYLMVTGAFIYFFMNKAYELNESKEDQQRLSTLINSMVDFVNFKDGQGRWIEANDFGLQLFQLENVDYRGKKDSELAEYTDFYGDALRNCEISDKETWKNKKITRVEEALPLPDGTTKVFDTIKVPLFNLMELGKGSSLLAAILRKEGKWLSNLKNGKSALEGPRSCQLSVNCRRA